jgi:hypothetical protein
MLIFCRMAYFFPAPPESAQSMAIDGDIYCAGQYVCSDPVLAPAPHTRRVPLEAAQSGDLTGSWRTENWPLNDGPRKSWL